MALRKSAVPPNRTREVFLTRSMAMLKRLSAVASPETIDRALSAPSDIGGMAVFLSDLAPLGVDVSTVDPFAEALARGAVVKQELLREAGGGLSAGQVAAALNITRQAVDKRRLRGSLLAVSNGAGNYLYPACQFTSEGVLPHLEDALQAFRIRSPWTQLSVLLGESPALGGETILEALRAGNVARALAVIEAFGEQGG